MCKIFGLVMILLIILLIAIIICKIAAMRRDARSLITGGYQPNIGLNLKITGNITKDLHLFTGRRETRFKLMYKMTDIPLKLIYKENNAVKHYVLEYDDPTWDTKTLPIRIEFVNLISKTVDNKICHIHNIHKIGKLSGTDMINFTKILLRQLGIKSAILQDGSRISCDGKNIPLSFLTLMAKGESLYEKWGFIPMLNEKLTYSGTMVKYGTTYNQIINKRRELVDEIKQLKTDYFVDYFSSLLDTLTAVKKKDMLSELYIYKLHGFNPCTINDADEIKNVCNAIISALPPNMMLYELILSLSKTDCKSIVSIIDSCFNWSIWGFKHDGHITMNEHRDLYGDLMTINQNIWFIVNL